MSVGSAICKMIHSVRWKFPGCFIILLFLQTQLIFSCDFRRVIEYLASDSLGGRLPGSPGEVAAANYIAAELEGKRTTVSFQEFTINQDIARNVIAFIDNGRDSTVILAAHYDHIGNGQYKSNEIMNKGIHPGADDNASGVAMIMALAGFWQNKTQAAYNLLILSTSAHESGLYGAEYFITSPFFSAIKCRAVINFDMVGRLDIHSRALRISGVTTDPLFESYFTSYTEADPEISFHFDDQNINNSDLKSFAARKLPVLNITTGIHEDYHKMSDTPEKINYAGMESIFKIINGLLFRYMKN
jgi:Zn-dependent M28 family amino/carboxypeptidase